MRMVKISLITTMMSIAFIYLTGCATQSEPDEYATAEPRCARGLKMQCFERRGQETKCRCVSDGEMAEMLEDLVRFQIQ